MGVFDVPATDLIEEIAKDLEKKFGIEKPAFTEYVKTGAHKERAPQREDWYFVRLASILYRVFKEGPVWVGSLRTYYGGKKNRGVKPHKFRKASGKIIRQGLQDLEKAGLIKKAGKGRVVSPKGHSFLVRKAKALKSTLAEKRATTARKKAEASKKLERERAEETKKAPQEPSQQKGKHVKKEHKRK